MNTTKPITAKPRHNLNEIALPDGDTLNLRTIFARETLGISDKTASRYHLPTVFVGGRPYVKRNASLQIIADKAKRANQPPKRRRA